jgi:hypothetical protein
MNETKDRIDDITTINFSITKCPMKIFKSFREFCKSETNDNYSFGLKILLDSRETNIKEVVLYELYTNLRDEFEQFKQEMSERKEKPKLKTLGSGGKKNE